jgi:8-oxo-dGTP pyrophosphatase MutT (NUDIX family)
MLDFNKFITALKGRISMPLPGKEAQLLMAPPTRSEYLKNLPDNYKIKKSSILILFYPCNNSVKTVLIRRAKYNGIHSGQISFPGGQFEKPDNNLTETALRETKEEIGIDISKINIIGNISELFIPPSLFLVLPVLGYTKKIPHFVADKKEVDEIFQINLSDLLDKNKICEKQVINSENIKINVPCFFIEDSIIWGATAMVISELIQVIRDVIDN